MSNQAAVVLKKIIGNRDASNVEELIDALKSLTLADPSTVYVECPNGNPLRLSLVEEILTDGSIVYQIVIAESKVPA